MIIPEFFFCWIVTTVNQVPVTQKPHRRFDTPNASATSESASSERMRFAASFARPRQFPLDLVRDFTKCASKQIRELQVVDAPEAIWAADW